MFIQFQKFCVYFLKWDELLTYLVKAFYFLSEDNLIMILICDFSDRDLEKLLEQWDEDEEPLPNDELPEWDPKKVKPGLDLSDMSKFKEPEDFLKASKKGQSVMMFVRVSGEPTRHEAEEISSIWQTGLWNNHVSVDRFMVEDDRAIFLFKVRFIYRTRAIITRS